MELISIELKNFKQYLNQKIEFGSGLTGIIGKNGSGKSTIFDGILTAFFGIGSESKKYLRSALCKENESVCVELILEKSGKHYKIIREYKGKNLTAQAQFFINDDLKATSHGAVNEEVEKLIGMDRDSFSMSVFAGQKDLGAISAVTGTPRRELIRRMTGMDRLDKVQQLVRLDKNSSKNQLKGQENILIPDEEKNKIEELISENRKKLKEIESGIKKTEKELESSSSSYLLAKKNFDELESAKNKFTSIDKLLTKKNETLKNNKDSAIESSERLNHLKEDEKEIQKLKFQEDSYHKLLISKETMDNEAGEHAKLEKLNVLIDNIKNDIAEKTKKRDLLNSELTEKEKLKKEETNFENNISDFKKKISQKRIEFDKLNTAKGTIEGLIKDRLKNLELIKKAGKDSACPACFRPLLDAYDSAIKKLTDDLDLYNGKELKETIDSMNAVIKEIADIEKDIKVIEKKYNAALKEISKFEEKEKQIEDAVKEISRKEAELNKLLAEHKKIIPVNYDKNKHELLKNEIRSLTQTHEKFIRLTHAIKDIPAVEKKITQLDLENKTITEEIKNLTYEIKLIPYTEKKYSDARSNREKSEELRDKVKSKLDNEEKEKNITASKLTELETRINEDNRRRIETEKLRLQINQLEKFDIYLDDFKKVALDRVRPLIAAHAGELFNNLTRGRYQSIFLDDNFDFYIMDEGESFPISRFSGGEIDLANLCLRIAISRTVSDMSGSENAGFLAFDEIFGSQDDERRGEILNAFHRLQEMYRQIFIISHIDEIKADFPRIMEISRGINGSTVKIFNG